MRRQLGFSLIELVAVMVLLGIVAAASTVFISASVGIYSDTARRSELNQQGRFALERISRQLRGALPNSVRVVSNASQSCVEFMPVVAASSYLNAVAGQSINSLTVVAHPTIPTAATGNLNLVIYNGDNNAPADSIANNSLYDSATTVMVGIDSISAAGANLLTINLDNSHSFNEDSPQRRFFIIDPAAITQYCARDNRLERYQGYSLTAVPTLPAGNGDLLAAHVRLSEQDGSPVQPFTYTPGTLQRSAVVYLDLRFSSAAQDGFNEWLRFTQEVQLRNVP
jgi:MSHA biogenesis protein MshO